MTEPIQPPVARAQMLIRSPVERVFAAVVDPAVTSRFWFTRGSGPLVAGARVRWEWEMYGAGTDVEVREVEQNRRVRMDWNGPERPTWVEWTFEPRGEGATFVTVANGGFHGPADEAVAQALGSTGGFSFVLAGLKAFLEHGIVLGLVEDHAPDGLVPGWTGRHLA